jgi:predicted alpha/beta hydrolase family esterase
MVNGYQSAWKVRSNQISFYKNKFYCLNNHEQKGILWNAGKYGMELYFQVLIKNLLKSVTGEEAQMLRDIDLSHDSPLEVFISVLEFVYTITFSKKTFKYLDVFHFAEIKVVLNLVKKFNTLFKLYKKFKKKKDHGEKFSMADVFEGKSDEQILEMWSEFDRLAEELVSALEQKIKDNHLFDFDLNHEDFFYRQALKRSEVDAKKMYQSMKKLQNLENVSFVGYSLGTQFVYYLLREYRDDTERTFKIQNVFLMGGVLDSSSIFNNFKEFFLVENKVINGKVVIGMSANDDTVGGNIEHNFFNATEETILNEEPIGHFPINYTHEAEEMMENDWYSKRYNSVEELESVLRENVRVADFSDFYIGSDDQYFINHEGYRTMTSMIGERLCDELHK